MVWATMGGALWAGCGGTAPTASEEPDPWADPLPPRRAVERPPNVLLVVWDTTRADRTSLHGHDVSTTPHMEERFRDGLVFDRAVSPSFWTLPSHASLFTGLPSSAHGAHAGRQWLDGAYVTLAEHLGDNGFDTYAWSSNPNIHPSKNTHQGFKVFNHPLGRSDWAPKVEEWSRSLIRSDDFSTTSNPNRWQSVSHHKHGPVANEAFFTWLDGRADAQRPFFGFVNYMEAHAYRLPTEASRRAVMPEEGRYQRALRTSQALKRMTEVMYGRWKGWSRAERQALYNVYDASVRDLDNWTEALFAGLASRGMLDDTVVVLTSDHGEQLGEHGLWLHNFSLYEPLVNVPLAIRYPKAVQPGRVDFPVSGTSIFATVVDLTGVPAPAQRIEPHSLAAPAPYPVVSDFDVPCGHPENRRLDTNMRDWPATYTALYDGPLKYIEASNDLHELYDLGIDMLELDNQAVVRHEDVARLSARLAAWRAGRPVVAQTDAERELEEKAREANADDDLMDQLEELGYVNEE
jgi:arylsulfatase A-like enzyme